MMEEWKTLPYALNYDVSNCGEIKQNKKNKILKPYINKNNGYAIHITKLEIFDKPKELSEYKKCYRSKGYPQYQSWYLTKAPQSWQYIEVEE